MANIILWVRKDWNNKKGESPVYAITHIAYKKVKINTGILVNIGKKEWDFKEKKVKGYSKNAKDKNLAIQKVVSNLNQIMIDLRLEGIELTADRVIKEYKTPRNRRSFYKYFEEQLAFKKAEGIAVNTYNRHKYTIEQLKKFRSELMVSEIDEKFIQDYTYWLRVKHKNGNASINMKIGVILVYLRLMLKHGLINKINFEKPKLKRKRAERLAMTEQELEAMWDYYNHSEMSKRRKEALRKFLFMCFTGMRISDLREISMNDIQNNALIFKPVKTKNSSGIEVRVPITKYVWDLILDGGEREDKLFDDFSHLGSINLRIQESCKELGINKKLSCHSGRHTFATLWLEKTKDVAKLQKLLGHSKIEMTMTYVHVTEQAIIEEMGVFENSFRF